MNPVTDISTRQRTNSEPLPAGPAPTSAGEDTETVSPSESSPVRLLPGGRRITRYDVALAANNGERTDMPMREVDEQIRRDIDRGKPGRVALLAEHRLRMLDRRRRDAFPDDPGPRAA